MIIIETITLYIITKFIKNIQNLIPLYNHIKISHCKSHISVPSSVLLNAFNVNYTDFHTYLILR